MQRFAESSLPRHDPIVKQVGISEFRWLISDLSFHMSVCRCQLSDVRYQLPDSRCETSGWDVRLRCQTSDFRFLISFCRFQMSVCRVQISHFTWQVCRFQISDLSFQRSDSRSKMSNFSFPTKDTSRCRFSTSGFNLQISDLRFQISERWQNQICRSWGNGGSASHD